MADAEVGLKIPEKLITDVVHAEIAKAMANRTELVEAAVKAMLTKKTHSYDRETDFEKWLREALMAEAKNVAKEWIQSQRETIRASLLKALGNSKSKRLNNMVRAITDQLGQGWRIDVQLVREANRED